jgi:hypothetical protein
LRKSESSSTSPRHKPNSLRRSRVLKRGGAKLVPLAQEHFPFAWAAYRRGVFEHIPDFPEGLDAAEFTARLADTALTVARMGGEIVVAIASTPQGNIPLALATVEYSDGKAFPHAIWFPEASYRNKLELGLMLFIALKEHHLVLVTAQTAKGEKSADVKFFEHLGKYGVLRRVGTIHGYFGSGQNAVMFQSVVANGQERTKDIRPSQEPSRPSVSGDSDAGLQPPEADAGHVNDDDN